MIVDINLQIETKSPSEIDSEVLDWFNSASQIKCYAE
jgi:hypothetical protein